MSSRPLFALLALVPILAACDSPPPASSLREWTASDHDRAEESARAASGQQKASGGGGKNGPDALLEATWTQQCVPCHGPSGHGDGPTGPMVHAADLTRPDWQASVSDAQIAAVITNGKGKMPAFANLPPKVVSGLVAGIRELRGR